MFFNVNYLTGVIYFKIYDKDKNRLIAEKSISVIQEFKRLEDFEFI